MEGNIHIAHVICSYLGLIAVYFTAGVELNLPMAGLSYISVTAVDPSHAVHTKDYGSTDT